jgi:uncharacterized NAD-dependent epimerase/dehydratase family protein
MIQFPEGTAVVYCEGAYNTPNGKTAHGLVRFTQRYNIRSVIDSRYSGQDAGMVIDQKKRNIPIYASIESVLERGQKPDFFVVGLAPDGGRLSSSARENVKKAITAGMHVDCGLHDYLTDDMEITDLARKNGVRIRDIRKSPKPADLHFFCGKIEEVNSLKVAVLGTDSAVGKRTTAWLLVHALRQAGYKAEMIGTGQTAWMQGAKYCLILDSLISDFMSGEIEHAIWQAWHDTQSDVLVVEGQGSLMNPAYPGGYEILAAARPDVIVLQHAPARTEYDGFPGYPIHPLSKQIEALQFVSGKPVIAITINHENMDLNSISTYSAMLQQTLGIPAMDVLMNGAENLARLLVSFLKEK